MRTVNYIQNIYETPPTCSKSFRCRQAVENLIHYDGTVTVIKMLYIECSIYHQLIFKCCVNTMYRYIPVSYLLHYFYSLLYIFNLAETSIFMELLQSPGLTFNICPSKDLYTI